MNLIIKTPIWTGDIDLKSDRLQSTGIIGSLRWWTEAILRGIGKFACDPIGNSCCPIKVKKNDKEVSQYCSACLIFGATGLRRTFKLSFEGGKNTFHGSPIRITPRGRNRGWYLGSGIVGEMHLDVIPLDKDFNDNLFLIPLTIISKWGAIGAKTQLGYGVVKIDSPPKLDFSQFKESLSVITDKFRLKLLEIGERNENNDNLPDMKDMFFAKVQFEVDNDWWKEVDGIKERGKSDDRNYNKGYVNDPRMVEWIGTNSVPITPAIKNWLRFCGGKNLWNTGDSNKDRAIENWLFGTIKGDKITSKINISCAYSIADNLWEFRIWGWIPKSNLPNGFNKDNFLNELKSSLEGGADSVKIPWNHFLGNKTREHQLKAWREYNTSRDTEERYESIIDYIQSLIDGKEETE